MTLYGGDLYGVRNKYKAAIDRIKMFEPDEGYFLAFSGGKDSQTIYHLSEEAGVKFDAHYHLTTVDPPELVHFIKRNYPDVIIDRPEETMWELIARKGLPPTHNVRYCCEILKEGGGDGRHVMTGVRWEESVRRKNTRSMLELNAYTGDKKNKIMLNNDNDETRKIVETFTDPSRPCKIKGKRILNPIIDWTIEEVWEYLNERNIPHCSLYDEGFKRLGCIGCPLANMNHRLAEFERWPKYKDAYLRAFDKMLINNRESGRKCSWPDAEAVMDWWLDKDKRNAKDKKMNPCQTVLEEVD